MSVVGAQDPEFMYMSTPLKAISEDDRQWSVCMCREEGKLAATSDLPQVMFSTIASIRRSVNHSRIIVPPFYFQLNKNQLTSQISLLGQLCKLSSYHCQPPHWGYLIFVIVLFTKVRQGAAIVQFQIRHGH